MSKILFVSYGGGHSNIVNELAQHLLTNKDVEFNILALTSAYDKLKNNFPSGIVRKISDYRHYFGDWEKEIDMWGGKFFQDNYRDDGLVSREDTIFYIGCSFYDLIIKYGEEEAQRIYSKTGRRGFLPTNIIRRILLEEDISTVVATTAPRFEYAALLVGNELGKRTIQILDLFGEIYPLPIAKNIVTMNINVTRSLISQGVAGNFYELGQPSIERTVKEIGAVNVSQLKSKLGIDQNRKVLLLAAQKLLIFNEDLSKGDWIDNARVYKRLISLLRGVCAFSGVELLVRIHPSESLNFYRKTLGELFDEITFVNSSLTSIESVAVSDYVVTHSSTLGLEAVLSEKTVFTYRHDSEVRYPLKQLQNTPFIHCHIDELEKVTKEVIGGQGNESMNLVKFDFPNDAVSQISNLIVGKDDEIFEN